MDKYDIKVDMTIRNSSTTKILERVSPNSTVLEFGSAHGAMTRYMHEELGCRVYVVEMDKQLYDKSMMYADDGVCGNASDLEWLSKFSSIKFDFILFSDVLEHLYDPHNVLKQAVLLLKEDGRVLISIPNIAHSSIIIDLLQNKFEYKKEGLLDSTHIRFFTYTSLLEMVDSAGLVTTVEDAIYMQPFQTEINNDYSFINASTSMLRSKNFDSVYQFVFEAVRVEHFSRSKNIMGIDKKIILNSAHSTYANIYYDTGSGFNEIEQVTVYYNLGTFSFTINLPASTTAVRFDPMENLLCAIKGLSVYSDIGHTKWQSVNGHTVGEYQVFLTKDPQILVSVNPGTTWVRFEGHITIYDDDFFVGFFSRTRQLTQELTAKVQELATKTQELEALEISKAQELEALERLKAHELEALEISKAQELEALERLKAHELEALEISKAQELEALEKRALTNYNDMVEKKNAEITQAHHELGIARADYQAIYRAFWWRITKPARLLTGRMKQVLRGTRQIPENSHAPNHGEANGTAIEGELVSEATLYKKWIKSNEFSESELQAQREMLFAYTPKISIVTPLYQTPESFLTNLLESVRAQTYPNWELCLVDAKNKRKVRKIITSYTAADSRIRYRKLAQNLGISENTNLGIEMASGSYVLFLDHDDTLSPSALYEVVKALNLNQEIDVLYSDQDKITHDENNRIYPFFKPGWSPEYFRQIMYVGHLLCVKKSLLLEINCFDKAYDGIQDYDLMLRLSEKTNKIHHIPKILYHWRISESSIAGSIDAKGSIEHLQEKAVNAHLRRCNIDANAVSFGHHRIKILPNNDVNYPKISIIIPTKDAPELIGKCLHSIYDKTTHPNFEVIIGDNGTTDSDAKNIINTYDQKIVSYNKPFNFSEINNLCAKESEGEFLVFLNNDTEIITEDWLEELLFYAKQSDVGAVGALLVYPDMTVQHAGIALGMRGTADHVMRGFPSDSDGYYGSLKHVRELSGVTAACMMISKQLFYEVGGFNQHYAILYQDVDLCCALLEKGYRNIFNPNVIMKHYESVTRSSDYNILDRLLLLDRFGHLIECGDRYYNKNFNLEAGNYQIGD